MAPHDTDSLFYTSSLPRSKVQLSFSVLIPFQQIVTNFGDRLFGVLNITSFSLKSDSTAKMVYNPIEGNYDNKILDFNQDTA